MNAKVRLTKVMLVLAMAASVVGIGESSASASTDTISNPDPAVTNSSGIDVVMSSTGMPVVAYSDVGHQSLVVLVCGNAACTSGNTKTTFPLHGWTPSLQLDSEDNPVIAAYDADSNDLVLIRCDTTTCSGDGVSISRPDTLDDTGFGPSLQLDADDNPIISYINGTKQLLKIMTCNDPLCVGDDETIGRPLLTTNFVGLTSMQIGPNGNPVVVATQDGDFRPRVIICNDAKCIGRNESVHKVPARAFTPSLQIAARPDGGHDVAVAFTFENTGFTGHQAISVGVMSCPFEACGDYLDGYYTHDPAAGARGEFRPSLIMTDTGPSMAFRDLESGRFSLQTTYFQPEGVPERFRFARTVAPDYVLDDIESVDHTIDDQGGAVVAYVSASKGLKILRCDDAGCVPTCNGIPVNVDLNAGSTAAGGIGDIPVVLRGTPGDDTIWTGRFDDTICAGAGDDIIKTGEGADKVFAGAGNDQIFGYTGNDRLVGGPGNDLIAGGPGNDRLFGGPGRDDIKGGPGNDRLSGGDGPDTLRGAPGNDQLFGNLGVDALFGDAGNDILKGGAWIDTIDGGAGADDRCGTVEGESRVNCERGVFGL